MSRIGWSRPWASGAAKRAISVLDGCVGRFEQGMAALQAFIEAEGTSAVARSYVCADGFRLGIWVHNMRSRYHRGALSESQIAVLQRAGIQWRVLDVGERRDGAVQALRAYRIEHNALPPVGYVTAEGLALGAWLQAMRHRARAGSNSALAILEALDVPLWEREHEAQWLAGMESLRRYIEAFGDTRVPLRWRDAAGFRLGRWVNSRRADAAAGRLSPYRRDALIEVGFEFVLGPSSHSQARKQREDQHFQERVRELVAFVDQYGHAKVPVRYVTADGTQLGRWAVRQRRERNAGRLDPARVSRLEDLGFAWSLRSPST